MTDPNTPGQQNGSTAVDEILEINKEQKDFYNTPASQKKRNIGQKLWRIARQQMYYVLNHAQLWSDIYNQQREWLGDLSTKKVLDFGCYSGNALSLELAQSSKNYLGIDLSDVALSELRESIAKRNIENARVQAVDILSDDFTENDFDVVYAQGVLHHFKHLSPMLHKLADKMTPDGIIVSCDPLQTAWSSKLARAAYRPFQTNRDWEWPFEQHTFDILQERFEIVAMQGFMGYAKWALPIVLLNKELGTKLAMKLHKKDLEKAKQQNRHLWRCLQVIMILRKKK